MKENPAEEQSTIKTFRLKRNGDLEEVFSEGVLKYPHIELTAGTNYSVLRNQDSYYNWI